MATCNTYTHVCTGVDVYGAVVENWRPARSFVAARIVGTFVQNKPITIGAESVSSDFYLINFEKQKRLC